MKNLILLGGPMGVGKTAVSRALQRRLPACVFLDGDWCWDARPFIATEETRAMALSNITDLLTRFLNCSAYENVLFCWVLHRPEILDAILSRLPLADVRVYHASLTADADTLRERLTDDVRRGVRTEDVIERALARLPLYAAMPGDRLDTSYLTVEQAADELALRIASKNA